MKARIIFLIVFAAARANADEFTAQQLLMYCSAKKDSAADLSCSAYIAGFSEGLLVGKVMSEGGLGFCPPSEGLSGLQTRLIVENWMRQHPKALNEPARKCIDRFFDQEASNKAASEKKKNED
jgi:hypothetical protein